MPVMRQLSLLNDEMPSVVVDISDQHGEVFTRRWVVELILDLVGFQAGRDLASMIAVEPSCGTGAFLIPMVERLVESARTHGHPLGELSDAIRAFDLLPGNAEMSRKAVAAILADSGLDGATADRVAATWVRNGDFLLLDRTELEESADFVIGNPPYIRLEDVPIQRSALYRERCPTMRGRSDIYVGFIETGLRMLKPEGCLGFIVADRWMHNLYGADLRAFVADSFSVDTVLAMHDVDAFEAPVSAYPAVTVIRRGKQADAVIATTTGKFGPSSAAPFLSFASNRGRSIKRKDFEAALLGSWFKGRASWPSANPAQLALVAELERRHPPLEDALTGTRVGIGLATGADSVFLTKDADLVEPDRLLPMLLAKDTADGLPNWSGTFLVNPWEETGLVDLEKYPRLHSYLRDNEEAVRGRHVAQRNVRGWFRTIDRVEPGLADRPKLLLPDLKARPHPVLDVGHFYPHHNLYFVTSASWDLQVLGGLLLSDIADLFVGTYCVKMRGGCYRFQAQYLRRIRVPVLDNVTKNDRRLLADAFDSRDVEAASAVARRIYGVKE